MEERAPLIKQGWLRAILYLVGFFIAQIIFSIIGVVLIAILNNIPITELANINNKELMQSSPYNFTLLQFFNMAGTIISAWLFCILIDRKSFVSLGWKWKRFGFDFSIGSLIGIGLIALGFLIQWSIGLLTITDYTFNPHNFISALLLFTFVSISEELMVRGYILNNLMQSMNKYIALLISSLLFSVMHLGNPNVTFLSTLNIFLAGLILGVYYIHLKNLWFSIGMHLTWNFFQGPVFGYEVSGLDIKGIISQEIDGPDYLTGGAFGFEGSIFLTVFLIVSTIVLDYIYKKKK